LSGRSIRGCLWIGSRRCWIPDHGPNTGLLITDTSRLTMFPYLNLGPIGLPTAPVVYLLGIWLALYAVDRAARRLGQEPERLYALASVALLGGFVGARLVFVLLHWSSFDDNFLGIVWPLTSGYNALGGILIGATAAFFY